LRSQSANSTTVSSSEYLERQRSHTDAYFAGGPRLHSVSDDAFTRYIFEWRIRIAIDRLQKRGASLGPDSRFLILCAAEGHEGSVLCDLGFRNVTVSDISPVALRVALHRDPRLRGQVLLAEELDLPAVAFDIVLVQDGLHHLRSPVQGFTEMLRVCAHAAIFLEPHDSWVGRTIGTKWERNGDAVNYVFRWSRSLVENIASSYLGQDRFQNLSFSFWHHTPRYAQLGKYLGGERLAIAAVRSLKFVLDHTLQFGNQFCGIILKKPMPHVTNLSSNCSGREQ
jgi:SAM-dependent methyltransferase